MEYADLEVGGQYYCWTDGEAVEDEDTDCGCSFSGGGWLEVTLVGFVPVLAALDGEPLPDAVFCAVKRLSMGVPRGPMLLVCVSQMSKTVGR